MRARFQALIDIINIIQFFTLTAISRGVPQASAISFYFYDACPTENHTEVAVPMSKCVQLLSVRGALHGLSSMSTVLKLL